MKRTSIKIVGESGMGLLSVGHILSRVLKGMGYYVHSDREYPSLIKGGHTSIQIDFSCQPVRSLCKKADLMIALDISGLLEYLPTVKKGGLIVHGYDRYERVRKLPKLVEEHGVDLKYFPALPLARKLGGKDVMMNTVMLGLLWKILGFDVEPLKRAIEKQFARKEKLIPINLKCVSAGYEAEGWSETPHFSVEKPTSVPDTIILDGNMAIALGAIECGVRNYYAYPMSPASSVLTHLAKWANHSGMVVKQAEDEITAAQMAFGSMFMGSRSFTSTSGGGYDLMAETVSLAGITETPWVGVVCQRPGPGTGLPTWTSQGDLNMVIHSGHGEYAKVVMAASDPTSAYQLIQHAFNTAETYQVPVILLSEKVICESHTLVPPFKGDIPIKRGLVTSAEELEALKSTDRYKITESGVSKRWIPGSAKVGYYGNGDEHKEDGTLTEKAEEAAPMYAKRIQKLETIKQNLPDPEYFGSEDADLLVVGWGSTKGVMLDALGQCLPQDKKIGYLHYSYLWPLKTDVFESLCKKAKKVVLIEGNYMGQLGTLIESETHLKFHDRFLKYDGRPFYLEEVIDYLEQGSSS